MHVHGSWRFESFHRVVARRRDGNTGKIGSENDGDPPIPVRHNGGSIKIGTALLCNPGIKARGRLMSRLRVPPLGNTHRRQPRAFMADIFRTK